MAMSSVPRVRAGGFSVFGLLLAFSLIATFLFAVFWLWSCTCSDNTSEDKGSNTSNHPPRVINHTVVPLYAFEIEPGTVVLQSGDGEIFRILREYDSVERTGTGSPPLHASVTTSQPAGEYHYMPSYTRAHFQTRPSAPSGCDDTCRSQGGCTGDERPPAYGCGENVPLWTPINIRHN